MSKDMGRMCRCLKRQEKKSAKVHKYLFFLSGAPGHCRMFSIPGYQMPRITHHCDKQKTPHHIFKSLRVVVPPLFENY